MRIKIHAGTVVTVNERMDIWQPGYVVAEDGKIAAAGAGIGPDGEFAEEESAPHAILMPGLINAHTHSPSNLLKGTWSRLPLEIWRQYIRAGWREYSDEAIYVSAQLGVVEMLKSGCTCCLDHFYTGSPSPYMGALHAVRAMDGAGMRGALALTLSDRRYDQTVGIDAAAISKQGKDEIDSITRLESANTLADAFEFAETMRKTSKIIVPMVGPSAPHRCSDELLIGCMKLARELDTAVHIHVCETKGQYLQGRKLFGMSPVMHLDRLGVLNERLSMAHCVWLTDTDISVVAERGATIIHNPASNGKLGSGRMRFDKMLAEGVRLGVATDGTGSNDNQNMFESMRFAAIIHNQNDEDYLNWPAPDQILKAATADGAYALGLGGKVGSIAAGRAADLVLLTTQSYHFAPLNNVVNQLVYCENGVSVRNVMVNGRWVVKDGEVLTIDVPGLYRRAIQLREEMDERLQRQFVRTAELEPALREAYLQSAKTAWTSSDGAGA
jgi:cytosine/adenosine deaminase-related metal-dependent hydrolase